MELSKTYKLYQNFKSKSNIGGTEEWRDILNIASKYFDVEYNNQNSLIALKLDKLYNSIITGVDHEYALNHPFIIISPGDLIYLTNSSYNYDPVVAYKYGYLFYYRVTPIGGILGLL